MGPTIIRYKLQLHIYKSFLLKYLIIYLPIYRTMGPKCSSNAFLFLKGPRCRRLTSASLRSIQTSAILSFFPTTSYFTHA